MGRNRVADYFKIDARAIGRNRVTERFDRKKKMEGANGDIFEVSSFNRGIIKCN